MSLVPMFSLQLPSRVHNSWLLTLVDDILEELSLSFLLASVHIEVVQGWFGTVAHLVMLLGHLVLGCGEVRLTAAALVDAQSPV